MSFNLIDIENWKRKEHFFHYFKSNPCAYSLTVELDITALLRYVKRVKIKFYPVIIYLISSIVNKHDEFKTSTDSGGMLGIFDELYPVYTVFHEKSETFSTIWSEYNRSFAAFYKNCLSDAEKYRDNEALVAKPNCPANVFHVSMLPWIRFSSLNLNIYNGSNYLLPVFTVGRYFEGNDKILLPLAIQAHHAVCDGFHVSRFVNDLQESMIEFDVNSDYQILEHFAITECQNGQA